MDQPKTTEDILILLEQQHEGLFAVEKTISCQKTIKRMDTLIKLSYSFDPSLIPIVLFERKKT